MKNIAVVLGLLISLSAFAAKIGEDTLILGRSTAGDKTIIFENGAGTSNPKFKWENSTSKFKYSLDGTNFLEILAASPDNSTIENASGTLRVKDSGITTAKIGDGQVTPSKQSARNYSISASSGNFSGTSGAGFNQVTNLSTTVTTNGRPVMLSLVHDGVGTSQFGVAAISSAATAACNFKLTRNSWAVTVGLWHLNSGAGSGSVVGVGQIVGCPGTIAFEAPSAGTYTYDFLYQAYANSTCYVQYCKLLAVEL